MYTSEFLRKLRNDIEIGYLIREVLKMPGKYSEGYFRFLCPLCFEFNTAVKKETNLARCFRCKENFNTIDLVMVVCNLSFLDTVLFLEPFLNLYNSVS